MSKRLYISLIFSNLVVIKTLSSTHRMYNLYTKFVKILEICKQFSENLVNESGNVPRRGPVPKFSDFRNYAKITNGLFARIIGKISALTILQYVNFINNKPIGRIKYALN